MSTDRFSGPEYVVGKPVMPELIRFNPEHVTPDVLAQFRVGSELPINIHGVFYNYNNLQLVNTNGRQTISDEGFRTEIRSTLTAEDVDEKNRLAILRRWNSESPSASWVPFMSREFQKRHLGSTHRVYIGFFERAIRRARGLSNDIWHYHSPTESQEMTAPLTFE